MSRALHWLEDVPAVAGISKSARSHSVRLAVRWSETGAISGAWRWKQDIPLKQAVEDVEKYYFIYLE